MSHTFAVVAVSCIAAITFVGLTTAVVVGIVITYIFVSISPAVIFDTLFVGHIVAAAMMTYQKMRVVVAESVGIEIVETFLVFGSRPIVEPKFSS